MPEQRRPRASWYHPREEEVPHEQKVNQMTFAMLVVVLIYGKQVVTSAPPPRQPRVSYIPMPAGTVSLLP